MTTPSVVPTETSPKPVPKARPPGLIRFLRDESGQDLIEYALLAALIALAATTAVKGLGTKIASAFTTVSSNLTSNT